ncbi:threonine/serine dehydratase [Clostridiaceae bacterium HSG29]|nr:threonine/serine dehydratase [Clostridiaceae bacterium HSG29]
MLLSKDIYEAKKRIEDYIIRTPLLRVQALDKIFGCEVYIKPENLQYTGSFKLRGATNRLLVLNENERKKGVVCASSGNHAQGVACAASRLDIDAVIVMPTDCNLVKLDGVKKFGATALLEGTLSSERENKALELVEKESRVLIHPYDDDYVRAGQGTIGIEILEDEINMDVIVVPIGGGGLISGISTIAKEIKPSIKIVGVEPEGAARYGVSRKENKPMWLDSVNTIADGTRTDYANETSYKIIEKLVDELVAVSDNSIKKAMLECVSTVKIVAEPSSVMGIAAAFDKKLDVKYEDKVCFVITGGNNDVSFLADVLMNGTKKDERED